MPDLRIDAIARLLVGTEMSWLDAGREVILHAGLLAAKEASHADVWGSVGISYGPVAGDRPASRVVEVGRCWWGQAYSGKTWGKGRTRGPPTSSRLCN